MPAPCFHRNRSISSFYNKAGRWYNRGAGINGPHIIDQPFSLPGNMNHLHAPGVGEGSRDACLLKYRAVAVNTAMRQCKGYFSKGAFFRGLPAGQA